MKRVIVTIILLAGLVAPSFASPGGGDVGIGIAIGLPTGLTGKCLAVQFEQNTAVL